MHGLVINGMKDVTLGNYEEIRLKILKSLAFPDLGEANITHKLELFTLIELREQIVLLYQLFCLCLMLRGDKMDELLELHS